MVYVLAIGLKDNGYVAEIKDIGFSAMVNGKCTYSKAEEVNNWNKTRERKRYAEETQRVADQMFDSLKKSMNEE
jgi:hypothetical protein